MTIAGADATLVDEPSHFLRNLLVFGRLLQRAGLPVHAGRLLDVVQALGHVHLGDRDEVYHACRTLLVHRQEHLVVFDRVFAAFWSAESAENARNAESVGSVESAESAESVESGESVESVESGESAENAEISEDAEDTGGRHASSTPSGIKVWSDRGGLADKDFAAFTDEELAEARGVLARLAWDPGERRTRRWVRGRGRQIDLRRAIAASLRTGGDVASLPRRKRRLRPRPLLVLCDVSASMERYTRMLLHFAHAVSGRDHRVEAFLFATQLTRITPQLQRSHPDEAVSAVARSVRDWSGGTRIGEAIKQLHRQWGSRVLAGSPVVLLISDGWDRGDPEELRTQVARLQRRCHRLIWLNPLLGTVDYAPLTRGLQAALPYVDDFLPSRTLTNLAQLALHLDAIA